MANKKPSDMTKALTKATTRESKPAAMTTPPAPPAVASASRDAAGIASTLMTPATTFVPEVQEFQFNPGGAETPIFFATGGNDVEVYGRRLTHHARLFNLFSATDLHAATLRHFSDTHSSAKKLSKLKLHTPAGWLAENQKELSPMIDALGDANALSYRHLIDDNDGPAAANRDFAVYVDTNGVWLCAALLARYAAWLSKAHAKCFAADYVIR